MNLVLNLIVVSGRLWGRSSPSMSPPCSAAPWSRWR